MMVIRHKHGALYDGTAALNNKSVRDRIWGYIINPYE